MVVDFGNDQIGLLGGGAAVIRRRSEAVTTVRAGRGELDQQHVAWQDAVEKVRGDGGDMTGNDAQCTGFGEAAIAAESAKTDKVQRVRVLGPEGRYKTGADEYAAARNGMALCGKRFHQCEWLTARLGANDSLARADIVGEVEIRWVEYAHGQSKFAWPPSSGMVAPLR